MKCKAEDVKKLLAPRFEVVADYPGSYFKVGTVISTGYDTVYCDQNSCKYSDFPHLFRKLGWWEHRIPAQMPRYVKMNKAGVDVILAVGWWTAVDDKWQWQDIHSGARYILPDGVSTVTPIDDNDYNSSVKQ